MEKIALHILKKNPTFHVFCTNNSKEMEEKVLSQSKIFLFIAMFSVADTSQGWGVHAR